MNSEMKELESDSQQTLDNGQRLEIEASWAVDKGQRRDNNEDSAGATKIELIDGDSAESVGIFAVADGMGGYLHGEVASTKAVHTTVEEIVKHFTDADQVIPEQARTWLENAVTAANKAIYGEKMNMGTTLVASVIMGKEAFIANVGDSRTYLINEDGIQQITEDQSFVQHMVNEGIITPEEARAHPRRNVLSQALGMEEDVKIDTYSTELNSGDYLLLCSDGLTNELEDQTIQHIVLEAETPHDACQSLVEAANQAGGRDNISVVLVQMK